MRASIFIMVVASCASAIAQQNILPTETAKSPSSLGNAVGQPANANVLVAQPGVGGVDISWRYRQHNGRWWYWLPSNRWVIWDGSGWVDYVEPAYSVQPTYSVQPYTTYRYGYDSSYYGGYGSRGYGSYYSPGYGAGIYLGGNSHYGHNHYGNGHSHYGHGHSGHGHSGHAHGHSGHGHSGHGHGGHGHGGRR